MESDAELESEGRSTTDESEWLLKQQLAVWPKSVFLTTLVTKSIELILLWIEQLQQ